MRIIPKKTKVETELFKGVSIIDVLVGLFGAFVCIALITSNLPYRWWIAIGVFVVFVFLLMPLDDEKVYMLFVHFLRHFAIPHVFTDKKKAGSINVEDITPFTGIDDRYINYNKEYYATVIEIPSIEFRFLSEYRQDSIIDHNIGAIIRTITQDQTGAFVKIDRPVIYDEYVITEHKKIKDLKQAFLDDIISEDELTRRVEIIYSRIEEIKKINFEDKVYRPFHYMVLFDKKKPLLSELTRNAVGQFRNAGLDAHQLKGKELAIFLKYQYNQVFDEREVDKIKPEDYMEWIIPKKIELTTRTVKYDGLITHNLKILDYPGLVGNAWGYRLFNIPNTRVVMKFKPVDRYQSIKRIDRSLEELRGQAGQTGKVSRLMEINENIESLAELLSMLQSENESLFDVNTYVTIYDYELTERYKRAAEGNSTSSSSSYVSLKKQVKRILAEAGFKTQDLFMQTFGVYASSHISAYDAFIKKSRGIHSSSIAAAFPFVYPYLQDKDGMCFGTTGGNPVFVNFFQRDSERVNSNMAIIGKSGSGKSFATKTILSNLAADNSKIFILDPENEYGVLAKKLHGKMIDVGKATEGSLNPFQIITGVSDDEEGASNSFYAHLQFLEEFFKQILPETENDALADLYAAIPILLQQVLRNGREMSRLLCPPSAAKAALRG